MNHPGKANILLHNAIIHTLDDRNPQVESLLIQGDRITGVGSDQQLADSAGSEADVFDLNGRTVLPAFTDAHVHLEKMAQAQDMIDCETPSLEMCLDRIRSRAEKTSEGEWILGHGWNQNLWQRFGNASDLDAVAPQHPVYLTAKSLHAGWANSLALEQAQVNQQTPDPPAGRLSRDESGNPTGILFEEAMKLISCVIPKLAPEKLAEKIAIIQSNLWQYGIASVHDFDSARCLQALRLLQNQARLGIRVQKNILREDLDEALERGYRTGEGDDWIRHGALKLYADGALGPHTAAMIDPYESEPQSRGMLLLEPEEMLALAHRAVAGGIALAIHAIGDRACRVVLDVFESVRAFERQHGLPTLPHRIEHLQLVHQDDLHRPARYGIFVSMQPIHAISDMQMADHHWGERTRYAYAWKSQLAAGARLVFGSDAPVEMPDPFAGLQAAVTRRSSNGDPGPDGWIPAERIPLHDALLAYTTGPALAAGWSKYSGSLAPGCFADLIVLDDDPYEADPMQLADLKPLATMVAGEWRVRSF